MLGQRDVGPRHHGDQAVVDHCLGPRAHFLRRLEQRDVGPCPGGTAVRHELRGTEQRTDMHVVTARMHDAGHFR
ncbi:hypothetical protein J2X01_000312 [Arthrobacter ginsengisoli]|uniref:Uncharacterized protein n=1 Tax=Arthrobacter ginsengisoli TaxID=1356565 RepID=A0ABU1U774_9MICC|nr:hypothetical protein [Arthrobacter ginsengisoli]MDR7081043.1 hypothetical protein [Arthrobacter ginsengisoli]